MKGQFGDIAAACLCSRPDHIFIVFPEKRQGYNIEQNGQLIQKIFQVV